MRERRFGSTCCLIPALVKLAPFVGRTDARKEFGVRAGVPSRWLKTPGILTKRS